MFIVLTDQSERTTSRKFSLCYTSGKERRKFRSFSNSAVYFHGLSTLYARKNPEHFLLCARKYHWLKLFMFTTKIPSRMQLLFTSYDRQDILLCFMYSMQWQNRGILHKHNLLWLVDKIGPKNAMIMLVIKFRTPLKILLCIRL